MRPAPRRGCRSPCDAAKYWSPPRRPSECWRDGPRAARLAAALKGIDVLAVSEDLGRKAGELLAAAGSDHTLDAIVVALAAQRDAAVLTSDVGDIQPLADAAGVGVLDY